MNMRQHFTRRSLLSSMLAAGAAPWIVPAHVLGATGRTSPSGKLTVGVIGVGAQGQGDMRNFLAQDDVRVTALCDVNQRNIESAVRSDTLCQLALIAVKQGRKLRWDPRAERFIDDNAADAMLGPRPIRGDWRLPEVG